MVIPEGYKQTEIGAIPNDWRIKNISQMQPYITSGSRGWADYYSDFGDLFVRITNMNRGDIEIDLTDCKYVLLPVNEREGKRTHLLNDDILISITADIGIVSFVNERVPKPAYINQHIALVRINDLSINSQFVAYYLNHRSGQLQFHSLADNGAKAGMSLLRVEKLKVPIPPTLTEQTAIATALSDIDALISTLEKLITKKRLIKQGAMQQLLGSASSPQGKPKEGWVIKKLGEVADIIGGGTPVTSNSDYWNGQINWFTPTEVGHTKYISFSHRRITDKGLKSSSANLLPIGTILLTTRATIGEVSILKNEACTNQGFQSLIVKKGFDNEFLYYLVQMLKPILFKMSSGSTFLEISPTKLRNIEISVPNIEVQDSIAQILNELDKEIEALENKFSKIGLLKQGMMQNLLTGKIRLV